MLNTPRQGASRKSNSHNQKLELDDRGIAVHWLTLVSSEHAPLKGGRAFLPPRLYHRIVEDAAFAILDDRLIPGYGSSGKAHGYFSSLPVEDITNQAGVRRDLPVEVFFETRC